MTIILLITLLFIPAVGLYTYQLRRNYLKITVNETIKERIVLKIAVPLYNDKKPLAAEAFFQSLHGTLRNNSKSKDLFSFEIVGNSMGIFFLIVCSKRYKNFIENQVYAQYPEAQITLVKDYVETIRQFNGVISVAEYGLARESMYPLNTFKNFEIDPLGPITSSISKMQNGFEAWIQIVCRPVASYWQDTGKSFVKTLKDSARSKPEIQTASTPLDTDQLQEIREIEQKSNKSGYQFTVRVIVKGPDKMMVNNLMEDIEASFKQFQRGKLNSLAAKKNSTSAIKTLFLGKRLEQSLSIKEKYIRRFLDEKEVNIINTEELASLYHFPNESVKTPNIDWARSKKLEIPANLPVIPNYDSSIKNNYGIRVFGYTDYRNVHVPFGIKKEDRRRHMYLIGKTGTGKSALIQRLVYGDIHDGEGFGIIDPHGELVEHVLNLIPQHRLKDVVYIDPSDTEYPVGLNMLDIKEGESMELLADGIVTVFKKFFGNSWGPRLQYILTNTVLTLLHCQNVSLLAVQRILQDKNYRKFLLKQVKDPFLIKFWEQEFEEMAKNPRLISEAVAPINNKVGRFLNSPMIRNMIGQIKSTIDFREIMDSGKILLVNLSQGKIGEENTSLLGGMLITRIYTNAMQRANMILDRRRDFYLYVDEFQNFSTDTFIKILSESRKYGLNLFVTHQYIDQISTEVQDAIFGNVGTLINYVVSQKDALRLQKEYAPFLNMEDLVNLEKFRMAIKLTIDGSQSNPFTGILMLPNFKPEELKEEIIKLSRESYASSKEEIEFKINKWAAQIYNDKGNISKD